MTRYSFRDHPKAAGLISKLYGDDHEEVLEETRDYDYEDKENDNRRASATDKSLYSHVRPVKIQRFSVKDQRTVKWEGCRMVGLGEDW